MAYIFVDTNIFLHFQSFDQIPWKQIVAAEFQLIVAPIVVNELDKHKRNKNNKIANKAKTVLKKIEEISSGNISYPLQYLQTRPSEITLREYQLDRNEQDDLLLATILEFKKLHPSDNIYLFSNDTGPRLRATNLKIDAIQLDEKYLLPTEKSDEEKTIEQLVKENNQLKNRIPTLKVTFIDGTSVIEFARPSDIITEEEYVNKKYPEETQELYPLIYLDPEDYRDDNPPGGLASSLHFARKMAAMNPLRPNQYQVEKYNEELYSYQNRLKSFLAKEYQVICAFGHSLKIEVLLSNSGNAPAEDIDLELTFPPNISVKLKNEMPRIPEKPKAPVAPKSSLDLFMGQLATFPSVHQFTYPPADVDPFCVTISINNDGSTANFYTRSLKHHQSEKMDTLYISFPTVEEMKNFTISYKLIVANIPAPVQGKLHVRIK